MSPTPDPLDDPPPRPAVSIVIPIYGRLDLTEACLGSLARTVDLSHDEVIVVDNASPDGSADAIARDHPWVTILRNADNLGFARACNQGAERAGHELLVILNNDTEAHDGWLDALVAPLTADPSVGLVGPKLLFPDGTLQHAGMWLVDDRRSGGLNAVHRWYRQRGDKRAAQQPAQLRIVTGAVMALRRADFLAVGGFDEAYWNGCEDVELCLRIGRLGLSVRYEPASVLVHHEGASGAQRWMKVTDNLRLLSSRWLGVTDVDMVVRADGSHVPVDDAALEVPARSKRAGPGLTVRLHGSLFDYHSLSQVNREFATRWAERHDIRVDPLWPGIPEMWPADDARLATIASRAVAPKPPKADVTLQHRWPPDWTPPTDGTPWIVVQPWEFGGLPAAWVPTIRDLVDELWVYTPWLRDCAIESGVPAHKVHVMGIGVDTARFTPEGARWPLHTRATTRFLYVGGAVHRKGLDVLLASYFAEFTPDDDVCLVLKLFGGDGIYTGAPHEQVHRMARDPSLPAIEVIDEDLTDAEMSTVYRSCTALVQPYRGEGFCMPVAEAMASGLPAIVTGKGAALAFCDEHTALLIRADDVEMRDLRELGQPATRYWLAEPDPEHLGELMRFVATHPEEAAAVGARARASVAERLDWEKIAARAAERLALVARRRPRRSDRLGAFDPAVVPEPLDDPRGTTVLLDATDEERARAALAVWTEAVGGGDDVTLVLAVPDATAAAALGAALDGFDGDVLAVFTGGVDDRVAAAYAACDLVLAAGDPVALERAGRMGRRVLRAASPAGLAAALDARAVVAS